MCRIATMCMYLPRSKCLFQEHSQITAENIVDPVHIDGGDVTGLEV
jgi:hypothetical protein